MSTDPNQQSQPGNAHRVVGYSKGGPDGCDSYVLMEVECPVLPAGVYCYKAPMSDWLMARLR